MKFQSIFFIQISLILFYGSDAQVRPDFINSGKVEYERKINVHASIEGDFAEEFKKRIPQYKTEYFNFEFANNRSIYKPGRESSDKVGFFTSPGSDNEIYTDLSTKRYTAMKQVFDKTYLIEDSTRKCTWKISNEIRMISGYNCRKATTIIMDSVFVVAFYCDQIIMSGGPESFSGLPGLILGLVIPRLHTTWYATKVEPLYAKEAHLSPPVKGKKINNTDLLKILKTSLKDWGKYGERNIWSIML